MREAVASREFSSSQKRKRNAQPIDVRTLNMSSKVAYQSKTDLVAEAIKEMVRTRELEPGMELRQREIAERLGVSPTPVREALRRLEAEGYVTSEPHHAAIVVWPEKPEIYATAVIRGTLEGLGAELAAKKVTPEDIADLSMLNERLANATDATERLQVDREFHLRICEITRSPALLAQMNLLWRNLESWVPTEMSSDRWVSEHEEIIQALSEGDCSEARAATNEHVLDGFKAYAPQDS
jgi:DNA-binding GntR family transcriptional regulator